MIFRPSENRVLDAFCGLCNVILRPNLHSTKPSSLLPAEPFPLNRRQPSPTQTSVRSPLTSASQQCWLVCAQDRAQKIESAQDRYSAIVPAAAALTHKW